MRDDPGQNQERDLLGRDGAEIEAGGTCFFSARYNVEADRIADLAINGDS